LKPSRLSFLARSDADIQFWKDLRIVAQRLLSGILLVSRSKCWRLIESRRRDFIVSLSAPADIWQCLRDTARRRPALPTQLLDPGVRWHLQDLDRHRWLIEPPQRDKIGQVCREANGGLTYN
jgi:hypothetical protein